MVVIPTVLKTMDNAFKGVFPNDQQDLSLKREYCNSGYGSKKYFIPF